MELAAEVLEWLEGVEQGVILPRTKVEVRQKRF